MTNAGFGVAVSAVMVQEPTACCVAILRRLEPLFQVTAIGTAADAQLETTEKFTATVPV
jgi:hypothetical protein